MGRYLKHPVHVELYGLPGSGKSTVATILAEVLRRQGYDVKEPSAEIDSFGTLRRVMKKAFRTVVFYLEHPVILRGVEKIVQKNGYTGLGRWPQMVNIAQKLRIYCEDISPCIYVWDEGIVQASVSLSIGGAVSGAMNEQWLRAFIPADLMIIKLYLATSMEDVNKRLASRKGGRSRVEKTRDETKRVELLRKFECACVEIESPNGFIKTDNKTAGEIAGMMQRTIERVLLNEPKECFSNGD